MTSRTDIGHVGTLEAGVFLAEMATLAALLYVGIALPESIGVKVLAAVALPTVVAVGWGRWLAPHAPWPLPPRAAFGLKVGLFAVVALLLALAGPVWVGVVFLVVTEALVVAAEQHRRPGR